MFLTVLNVDLFVFVVFPILKVRPEEVGGGKALNDIKSNFELMLGSTERPAYLTQMCYCKAPLARAVFERPLKDWRCSSCFSNQSGRVHFRCDAEFCIFKRLSGVAYQVCPSCCRSTEEDSMDEKDEDIENGFISRKMNRSINMIKDCFDALMVKRGDGIFVNALRKSLLEMNTDINHQSLQHALSNCDLSWELMKAETKESMIKRLQNSLSLSYLQCLIVYESMQCIDPDVVDLEIKERARHFHANLYQDFSLKCMSESCICNMNQQVPVFCVISKKEKQFPFNKCNALRNMEHQCS